MAFNYHFRIESVDCHVEKDGLENVIFQVHWRYFAEDSESGFKVDTCGMSSVSDPDPENFTPVDQLNNSDVVSWLSSIVDVEDLKRILDQRLNELITPTKLNLKIAQDPDPETASEQTDQSVTEETV